MNVWKVRAKWYFTLIFCNLGFCTKIVCPMINYILTKNILIK